MWARGIRRSCARWLSREHANATIEPKFTELLAQFVVWVVWFVVQLVVQLIVQLVVQFVTKLLTKFLAVEFRFVRRLSEYSVVTEPEWTQRQRVAVPTPAVDLQWWIRVAVPAATL